MPRLGVDPQRNTRHHRSQTPLPCTHARTPRNTNSSIGVIVFLLLYSVLFSFQQAGNGQRHLDLAAVGKGYAAQLLNKSSFLGCENEGRVCMGVPVPRSVIRQGTRTCRLTTARPRRLVPVVSVGGIDRAAHRGSATARSYGGPGFDARGCGRVCGRRREDGFYGQCMWCSFVHLLVCQGGLYVLASSRADPFPFPFPPLSEEILFLFFLIRR